MAKKKHFKKKSKKTPARSVQPGSVESKNEPVEAKPAAVSANQLKSSVADPAVMYVNKDVRRIGLIVGGFITLQLILAYLLNNTALGSSVYGLIKL